MNDYLKPFRGRIDRRSIAPATIAIVGAGRVGGWLALELARLVPRRLILVDGDDLEVSNLSGHPLTSEYVNWSKTVAMCDFLQRTIPGSTEFTAIPYFIDNAILDEWVLTDVISPASVVIVATDDLETQRRVAGLARAAEVPAIVPGIAADGSGRGEAFLSLSEDEPCAECFDAFRPLGAPVRGAAAVALDAAPAVHLGFSLTLAVLDPTSREAELLTPLREGGPVPQLFRAWPPGAAALSHADDGRTEVPWREDCPGCGGRVAPRRSFAQRRRERRAQRQRTRRRQIPRSLVWLLYGLELLFLVASEASGGVVVATMWASLALGFGVWIGRRLPEIEASPG